jgi:hypothetical protein
MLQPNTRREESYMHFPEGDQSPDWVFSEYEEASVDEGLVNNTLQGSRLSCMLTVFLPIAIRAIKPEFLKIAITRMCYFFSKISQKTIGKQELNDLHEFVVETQNQLEICLPPAFFDIMPHLMIHIVHQIQALGPCYLHEMWSYERFMSVLSRYMHN